MSTHISKHAKQGFLKALYDLYNNVYKFDKPRILDESVILVGCHRKHEILLWLQADPELTAKSLLERLQREHPCEFCDGRLRTLQRRIRGWRHMMDRYIIHM